MTPTEPRETGEPLNLGLIRSRRKYANDLAQTALSSGSTIAQALIAQVTADSERLDALAEELAITIAIHKRTVDRVGDLATELARQARARPDDLIANGRAAGMRQAFDILSAAL